MDFDFSKILKRTPTIKFLENEFRELDRINKYCNDWIHKNGYEKISIRFLNTVDRKSLKNNMYYVLKVFFMVVCCYDGKSLSDTEHYDSLEDDELPPEGSETWIAPVFQKFINSIYNNEEQEKIKNNCYMDIE